MNERIINGNIMKVKFSERYQTWYAEVHSCGMRTSTRGFQTENEARLEGEMLARILEPRYPVRELMSN